MSIGSDVKKHAAMLKKLFLTLALLPMAATVCLTALFVLPGVKDPVSLLKFPRTWYVVFSFVLFVLWTGVVALLIWLESRLLKRNSRGVIVLASIINASALLWLLSSLILSAAGFSGNVGTIRISNAGELSYIRNYPSGDYVLTQDIDMEKGEWKSIAKYEGSLNGNGHSILNITVGKDGIIGENLGTISSLTLSNVQYTDFEPGKEFGTLVTVNRGSVLSCTISPADGNANPAANVLVGCNYGICENNTGICYDRCAEHTYKLVSSTPSTFLEHGINSYICEVCGDTYRSVAVSSQPLKLKASIVLLLAAAAGIIFIFLSDEDHKYMAAMLSIVVLLTAFALFSYKTVGANVGKGETWVDRWLAYREQAETNPPEDGEGQEGQETGAGYDGSGCVFPNSSTELIGQQEAQNLSDHELTHAINEIYARHGYIFQIDEMRSYYEQFDWYNGEIPSDEFSIECFNQIEQQNHNLLVNERTRRRESG